MTTEVSDGALKATILVPTMSDRGPLLPVTIGCALAQSVKEIEVFIIGDGVNDATRGVIHDLMARDARVRFFDYEKHERRGEPNRHEALKQARGKIICYMCDRDLMLPNHVETMLALLENADFAHTLISAMTPEGTFQFFTSADLSDPDDRRWTARGWNIENGIPLSFAGHTLEMYRRLPHGWRTTPDGVFTDIYMWRQFLAQPDCRAVSGTVPTILYFPRAPRNDLTIAQKRVELERWRDVIQAPSGMERIFQLLLNGLSTEANSRGKRLRQIASRRSERIYRRLTRLWR
jgi:glycosyltransferase involved in cell wall biosynthesis